MKLDKNVKAKKFPWTLSLFFSTYTAHAIYPNVFLPKNIYEDLISKNPEAKNVAILIHEQVHIKRQKHVGIIFWMLKYCLIPSFRLNEELEAVKASMKYMKQKKQTWNTSQTAKSLSSYLYLWCVSYAEAKKLLDKTWKEIN